MASWLSRVGFVVAVLAVCFMFIIKWLGTESAGSSSITYTSKGWLREGCDWDAEQNRVLLSCFEGGIAEVRINSSNPGAILKEVKVVEDSDVLGNATWGIRVDPPRNRVLAAISNPGSRFSAVAAYDLHSWRRLFLIHLAVPDRDSFANDIAVDKDGNAYITDSAANLIWKVSPDASETSIISSPVLVSARNQLPFNICGLNGIELHPDGYLLVVHTWAGVIFRVSLDGSSVIIVKLEGSMSLPDGIVLLTPQRLVVVTAASTYLIESLDGWNSAKLIDTYTGPLHRVATAAFIRDDKAYVSYAVGYGLKTRLFTIRESFQAS